MSKTGIIRRAFELPADARDDLEKVKGQLNVKTDSAALYYALKLAARLSHL